MSLARTVSLFLPFGGQDSWSNPRPLPGGRDREKGGGTGLLQAGVQLGQAHLRPSQPPLPPGVASPWPAPHSVQELCFLLSQVLRAEAQSFQHPKWHVALMGLGCLLDGKAAWARNHASIQLFLPTPNKGSVSNQAEHFTCLCLLLKIYQLHSSSLEFLKGLGSL